MIGSTLVRNLSVQAIVPMRLQVHIAANDLGIYNAGALYLNLGPDLYDRWIQAGAKGQGVERVQGNLLQLFGQDAYVDGIPLFPDEAQQVEVQFRLSPNYANPQGKVYRLDLQQYGSPNKPDQLIGGQRMEFNFNKLTLVPTGSKWRYWDMGQYPGDNWRDFNYDDSNWSSGQAELGFGDGDETTLTDSGPITTWFRYTFGVEDPSLYRSLWLRLKADDGAVVYLNGVEVHRYNMPTGSSATPVDLASTDVNGLAEKVFFQFHSFEEKYILMAP